ncbi:MAG: hypothetical protein K0S41_1310 [Anaerocolumna sp.]|jgi:hypothetical protein|nr:hypothetical protein [Anaerocolumna sp.]
MIRTTLTAIFLGACVAGSRPARIVIFYSLIGRAMKKYVVNHNDTNSNNISHLSGTKRNPSVSCKQTMKGVISMLNFLKRETNITLTENGAVTNRSTNNHCLDFFYQVGALRNEKEERIIAIFIKAYTEDPSLAMKILFFARDVRGGLGERKIFRTCLKWLAFHYPETILKNMNYVSEYGRYDDLLALFDTPCEKAAINLISIQLNSDNIAMKTGEENISLIAKWIPSVNTSNEQAIKNGKKIARALKLTDAEYRKTLSKLRKYIDIIENHLREKDYIFPYEAQPSKAMFKYKKAFIRNDKERYMNFLSKVQNGEVKLKTNSLYPYDIIREALKSGISEEERIALDTSWKGLVSYENHDNAIAVVDGSGSMYGGSGSPKPYEAALSLGIYFAEHNTGLFANHFITFSENPCLVEIIGRDIVEKVQYTASFNEVANTNLEAVFQLLIRTAIKYKILKSEMPKTIYIISDMEFDSCTNNANLSNFENAKMLFQKEGYELPKVVFWNVASRNEQVPVTMHDSGVALVSGSSPRIFDMVKSGDINPMKLMIEIIETERYAKISA